MGHAEFGRLSILDRIVVLGLIGIGVAVTGIINLSHADTDLAFVWLAFLVYAIVIALPFLALRPMWGPLHPVVFTVLWWTLVGHVIPRLGIFANGLQYHRAIPPSLGVNTNLVVSYATFLSAIGLLSFYLGFLVPHRLAVPNIGFGPAKAIGWKIGVVAIVSFGAFAVLIVEAGGLEALLFQRGLARDQRINVAIGGAHWHFLTSQLKNAWLVWLALRPADWKKPIFWIVGVAALAVGFASTGSRSGVISPLIMALMIIVLYRRDIPRFAVAALAILAIFMVGILGDFRRQSFSARNLDQIQFDSGAGDWLGSGVKTLVDYGVGLDGAYAVLANVPERSDYLLGQSYAAIAVAPFPSAVLPFDKPPAGGRLLSARIFDEPLNAIPPGVVGESYWNFSVPGVVLAMFITGGLLQWMARLYRYHDGAGWVVAVYVVTLIRFQPTSDHIYAWLHAIVPTLLFLLFFCGLPRRNVSREVLSDSA